MMNQCKECMFYDEERDELFERFNDVSDTEKHYCIMYDNNIPDSIVQDKSKCKQFIIND